MLKPETALDSWREWDTSPRSRPTVVRELGDGLSNRSFLLKSADERMVLRINAVSSTLPGIGRDNEAEIWRAASDVGIAPPLLHADPDRKFLVSAYIENELPNRPQDDPAILTMAQELLRKTHQLDIHAPMIDYAAHIETYWQQIEAQYSPVNPTLQAQRESMQEKLAELLTVEPKQVLCHHDPVVENFVGSADRLYLIDWEYAARGLAVMDYAALGIEWGLDDDALAERVNLEPALLARAKTIYHYLCNLWETARALA